MESMEDYDRDGDVVVDAFVKLLCSYTSFRRTTSWATSRVRTARGIRLPAGRRGRSFAGDRFDSRCAAGTGRSCSRTARAVGGLAAAERVSSVVEALVEASSRGRDEARMWA